MNEGLIAAGVILATIGSAIALVWYRDLIFTTSATVPRRAGRTTRPRRAGRTTRPRQVETPAPAPEMVSEAVSSIPVLQSEVETVAFRALAKLVRAKALTETVALETVFDVSAGGSKAYKAVQAKLKQALTDLDSLN